MSNLGVLLVLFCINDFQTKNTAYKRHLYNDIYDQSGGKQNENICLND